MTWACEEENEKLDKTHFEEKKVASNSGFEALPIDESTIHETFKLAYPIENKANQRGIRNVFMDGNYPTLILVEMLNLTILEGKGGNDAMCPLTGREFELKTVNIVDSRGRLKDNLGGVTTEHTLRQSNIDRYRTTSGWIIGLFCHIKPYQIWQVATTALEPYFRKWEALISKAPNQEINNPKIPMDFIREHGVGKHILTR